MAYKRLSLVEAEKKMSLWKEMPSDDYIEEELDKEYIAIRNRLLDGFKLISSGQKYVCDYQFGMILYHVLKDNGFSLRDASNDDVWRFLSLCVIPDIVSKRWGKLAEIRYYKQSGRIWLRTIWWYIHLSWQNDRKKTEEVIKNNSTDQILQLVDRSGTKGYYVDVYRRIMYYFWVARKNNPQIGEGEFRKIMTLHTAVCKTIEPGLYEGGSDGYARMLYNRIGVTINED